MNSYVVFTALEFYVILFFVIMIGIIAFISSVGWYYEIKGKDQKRKAIKDKFAIDYHTAKFGGTANYKDYMADLEKNIRKVNR